MKKSLTAISDAIRFNHFLRRLFSVFILSDLFVLFSFPVSLDISILGFSINIIGALLIYVCVILARGLKKNLCITAYRNVVIIQKILEYIPFVFLIGFIVRRAGNIDVWQWVDLIAVLLWGAILVMSILCSRMLSEKKQGQIFTVTENTVERKKLYITVLEWVDAIVWSVFYVFLFNIFVFQLYEIPSESMVPSFMVKDRVFVFKTASGPRFPLSKISLPMFKSYERGDIVVLRNPRYKRTNKSECKSFFSQFVYMITATKVNLMRTDDTGRIIADPLVKRVVGVPGEQLVMVDGILYSRTSLEAPFSVVAQDTDYACWNLNNLIATDLSYVQRIPLTEEQFAALTSVESDRRNLDIELAKNECLSIASDFEKCIRQSGYIIAGNVFEPRSTEWSYLYQQFDSIAHKLIASEKGASWFSAFMTDWIDTPSQLSDPYTDMTRRFNIMFKLNYGKLILATVRNITSDFSVVARNSYESSVKPLIEQAQLYVCCLDIMDQRNMPVFPQNTMLEDGHYFMMGDNRFNSLDLRHTYDYYERHLDANDPYSITYQSNIEPISLSKQDILGTTLFRFWPIQRIGLLDN